MLELLVEIQTSALKATTLGGKLKETHKLKDVAVLGTFPPTVMLPCTG